MTLNVDEINMSDARPSLLKSCLYKQLQYTTLLGCPRF